MRWRRWLRARPRRFTALRDPSAKKHIRVIGACGAFTAVLLAPPLFQRVFALAPVPGDDVTHLWIGSLLIGGCSSVLLLFATARLSGVAALLLALLVFVDAELCTRLVVVTTADSLKLEELVGLGRESNPDTSTFYNHPFLSYVGNPGVANLAPEGAEVPASGHKHNNFGFIGDDFTYAKPPHTIRVACLGGSTTANGYPALLELALNKHFENSETSFEVLNFGLGGWTTAHSLVNYVLNVVDFEPDYLVIHHAWNDNIASDGACELRGDYYGLVPDFAHVPPVESLLMRTSVLYRIVKSKLLPETVWGHDDRIPKYICHSCPVFPPEDDNLGDGSCEEADTLWPFTRNIRTMIELAVARGSVVVLTTQPHYVYPVVTEDPGPHIREAEFIDRCNEVLRGIADDAGHDLVFVDLDRSMSGSMNSRFIDLGHLDEEGMWIKARKIADSIEGHYANVVHSSEEPPAIAPLSE